MHEDQPGSRSSYEKHTLRTLSESQLEAWELQGYFRIESFLAEAACHAMVERAWDLASRPDEARSLGSIVRHEANFPDALASEDRVSKVFRLHGEPSFRQFYSSPDVAALLGDLIGRDVDFFQSQIIFKLPGSQGQPWHQDAAVFPFEPDRPVVGLWLALTDAAVENSCMQVLPGSHTQERLAHDREQRPRSGGRYLALTNIDTSNAQPVPMRSGDLLVLDSHLIHSATDNHSDRARIAATFHFASTGTVDNTAAEFGKSPFNEWLTILRDGKPSATNDLNNP